MKDSKKNKSDKPEWFDKKITYEKTDEKEEKELKEMLKDLK